MLLLDAVHRVFETRDEPIDILGEGSAAVFASASHSEACVSGRCKFWGRIRNLIAFLD